MGQLIRPIAAILAAGLLCFLSSHPQGYFLGLAVVIVLMMVWVGLMDERKRELAFLDNLACCKEDCKKLLSGQTVKISSFKACPRSVANLAMLIQMLGFRLLLWH